MAPRAKAGPRVPVFSKVGPPPLTVRHRRWLREALDVGNDVDLAGFEKAIGTLITGLSAVAAGPTAREVAAEIAGFDREHLAPFFAAFMKLSPAARDVLFTPNAAANLEAALCEASLCDGVADYDRRPGIIDRFLREIIALSEAAGASGGLPSVAEYDHARSRPIFMTVRTAIDIAQDFATKYSLGAAPDLDHLAGLTDVTLIDYLHRARAKRRYPIAVFF